MISSPREAMTRFRGIECIDLYMPKEREACGRCGVSVTVDAVTEDDEPHDPYGDTSIEISEREARLVSPAAWLQSITSRMNTAVRRVIWERE